MNLLTLRAAIVIAFVFVSSMAHADCWRLLNGQIANTNAGSTAPVKGAQQILCPAQQQSQQQLAQKTKPTKIVDPCAKYYGRGYCTDYIQERVGRKPSGDAGTWPGNAAISSIRVGDAAIFSIGSAGHVAYVEGVIADKATGKPKQIQISEKNWGQVLSGQENQQCVITTNFGKKGNRVVPITSVARVWRP